MTWDLRRLGVVCVAAAQLAAQGSPFEELELRVSSLRPNGACVVDRGKRDQVQVGDHVVLVPRNGQSLQGRVIEVDERTSLVELVDPAAVVASGTRGHVLLPRVRLQRAAPTPPPGQQPAAAPTPPVEEWKPGMPLLGNTRPPRPEERAATLTGRVYGAANVVRTNGTFRESFLKSGVDLTFDNLGGAGGTLRVHGEFDWSTEFSDQTGADLRLYEFSYAHGGTRFEPLRWQVGRFLHHDMPEFGLLDGIEVGYRRENGDRLGASFGYLPELDDDLDSLADLEIAGWYEWNQDIAERWSIAVGYQKSWHRFEEDRDLFVLRTRWLPLEGWTLSSTLWIDYYTGSDALKSATVEVTRANLFLGRRWQRAGLELFADHEAYPELLRQELPQTIQPLTLRDAHQDRVSLHAYTPAGDSVRAFTRLTGWVDESREGGAVELGFDIEGLLQRRTTTTLAGFDVQGLTSSVFGVRVQHGGNQSWGRLDLLYELGFVHHEGFPDDRDDLLQHRFAAMASTDLGRGWDATFVGDSTFWDGTVSFGIGIWLQRIF